MWKPDSVKILQITSKHGDQIIYGLGDDGLVYKWSEAEKKWYLGLASVQSDEAMII